MFANRFLFTIGVSIVALLTSLILDRLLAPLSALPQFLIQIPVLVIVMDEFRRIVLDHASAYGLSIDDVNGTFFFAAPLASFGATSLFRDMKSLTY
jgi:hypothetical protein